MLTLENVNCNVMAQIDGDDNVGYDDGWRSYHYDEVGMDVDIRSNLSPSLKLSFHHLAQPFDDTINHKVIQWNKSIYIIDSRIMDILSASVCL